jgi:hypothetical protein
VSKELPEPKRFDDGDVLEVTVDGKTVARIEEINDISTSAADEAALITVYEAIIENKRPVDPDSGMDAETILETVDPDIEVSDTDGSEELSG